MEIWIILTKLAAIIYIAVSYIVTSETALPWLVLATLVFFSLNIAIYLVKKPIVKHLLGVSSILTTVVFYAQVHPLFILLIPISLYEVTASYIQKPWLIAILALAPTIWIETEIRTLYGLIAILAFIIHTMNMRYSDRLQHLEEVLTKMRLDMQQATKSLNENHAYMKQSEYTIKLEERNRLSQAIHDQIGHSMTGALIQMEASKRLMRSDEEKAALLLQNAIQISKEGIESIRLTLKDLKPPMEQLGINRMKLLVDDLAGRHQIQPSLVYRGDLEVITPLQWTIIQENTTEAITNAMKYSEARNISIDIHVLNKFVKVEVKDDGKGTQKIKKGLGIIGMEERTASIHGTIIIDGTQGFSVTMLIPIQVG